MKTLIVVLLLAWLVISLLGVIIEGLLWLLVIGLVLLAATALFGWVKLGRRRSSQRS
ncbi:hypothetical protein [Actinotalea sp. C106]|uniref:hypothetical protein n=1 Tax=Actinotalea sp. C106 TaxID=2908644 RepID=UPI002027B031|nr:hypothetical protein [Actinotalea sp. C106]